MSNSYCPKCGAHGFPSKEDGLAKCTHCGTAAHLPNKVQCPGCGNLSSRGTSFCAECGQALFKLCERCEKRGPADANFCAECGGKMVGHEVIAAREEAAKSGKAFRNLLIVGVLLAAAWFFCIAPAMRWFQREGVTWDTVVPTAGPSLSPAQIAATQQVEVAQRTRAFEDIDVRVGEITDRVRRYAGQCWDDAFASYPVSVRNNGRISHEILLAYYLETGSGETYGERYQRFTLAPDSEAEFVVEEHHVASIMAACGYSVLVNGEDSNYLLVRLEEVDGILRSETSWAGGETFSPGWDWRIRIVDSISPRDYPCDYGECRGR